jgi:MYXO-CTERM domain-containing protein
VITADPARGEPRPGEREPFSFDPLLAARQEAATVAAMFREPLMLQGADASEARVKQMHSPLIWHHIGHAHYQPLSCVADAKALDDPRLKSALAMAGANVCRDGDDDGLLTAVEVAGLDLGDTELVVLSACDTGVGATSLGDTAGHVADGVYGLRRALVIAGSQTQVMSLWKVDDHATRYLMEAYYRNLLAQGMGRSEALRQVQLAWLRGDDRYASPAYWAAFVVSGNDAPLDVGSASTVPRVQRSPRGCACDASSDPGQGWGMALLLGLVAVMLRRHKTGLAVKHLRR